MGERFVRLEGCDTAPEREALDENQETRLAKRLTLYGAVQRIMLPVKVQLTLDSDSGKCVHEPGP